MSKVSIIVSVVIVGVALAVGSPAASASERINTSKVPAVGSSTGDNTSTIGIWHRATIRNVSSDGDSLEVMTEGHLQTLAVKDTVLRKRVSGLTSGDMVDTRIEMVNGNSELMEMKIPVVLVSVYHRVIANMWSLLLLLLVTLALSKGKLFSFIVGTDGRYSNSKFQLAIWFGAFVWTYVTAVMLRLWASGWNLDLLGGLGIQQNILMLSGLSGLTFGAAKAITQNKADDEAKKKADDEAKKKADEEAKSRSTEDRNMGPATGNGSSGTPKRQDPVVPNFPGDLVLDNKGKSDLGDLQMLVISLIAVIIYFLSVFHFLGSLELVKNVSLPDVDTALLTAFGLGQGAYLIKKSAGKLGEA
jgi:hypothetical protein